MKPLKYAEKLLRIMRIKPYSVITNQKDRFERPVFRTDLDSSLAASTRVFPGIRNQVEQHLAKGDRVSFDPRQSPDGPDDLPALATARDLIPSRLDQGVHIDPDVANLRPAHARKREQIIDQLIHLPGRTSNGPDKSLTLFIQLTAGAEFQHIDETLD